MYYLYSITGVAALISFCFSKEKTFKAFKIALQKIIRITPAFLSILIVVSIVLFCIPEKMILDSLDGNNKFISIIAASLIGSIMLMPGPIAYPLCGILLKKGIAHMVVAAFSTTLMMVGILTYSVEKEYFGAKVTIIRNIFSFLISLIVAFIIGILFGELP